MATGESKYSDNKSVGQQARDFLSFLYNKEEGSCCGRTPKSWARIGVFYLIYYSCLAGFFAICLAVFFTTLDKDYPRQSDMDSLIKGNPGMGFRPMPDIETTLIRFEQGKPESYNVYTDHLRAFTDQYENENQESENFIDCNDLTEENRDKSKVCRFDLAQVKECNYQDANFGYDEGQPCILLKLNKVYGWTPESYSNETIPDDMPHPEGYNKDAVYVTCEGENPSDTENMGPVEFYPANGFSRQYYPYLKQEGYKQPFVFAKFRKPQNGVIIQLWCKSWASNIMHHKNDKAGSIHFELMVD